MSVGDAQRVVALMTRAEHTGRAAETAAARQVAAVADALDEAGRHPEVFVDIPPSGPSRDDLDVARRAAVADLAVRLHVAEDTVLQHTAMDARLRARAPQTWRPSPTAAWRWRTPGHSRTCSTPRTPNSGSTTRSISPPPSSRVCRRRGSGVRSGDCAIDCTPIGRMVRSPLARRIPGNDRLNAVDCILP